jgi:hypothetical protein
VRTPCVPEVSGDRVEQATLIGVGELLWRRIPLEAMLRHERAHGVFGSRERPLWRGHDKRQRRGDRAVPAEPALNRRVEAAQTAVDELTAGRIRAAELQATCERANLLACGPCGPDRVALMATVEAWHGV